jgi:hypothetical protein
MCAATASLAPQRASAAARARDAWTAAFSNWNRGVSNVRPPELKFTECNERT